MAKDTIDVGRAQLDLAIGLHIEAHDQATEEEIAAIVRTEIRRFTSRLADALEAAGHGDIEIGINGD